MAHLKIKIVHSHDVPNLYGFIFFHGTKKESYAIFQVFHWFVYVSFRPFSGQNKMVY